MSVTLFNEPAWHGQLLMHYENARVFTQLGVVNNDYQGDVDKSVVVHINAAGRIPVKDYVPNQDMDAPFTPSGAQTTLLINRLKYIHFAIDNVDMAQTQGQATMMTYSKQAGIDLADEEDRYIAGFYTEVPAENTIDDGGSPIDITDPALAYEYIVDLQVKLNKKAVPLQGRWVVVPPEFYGLLLKDDRFVKSPNPVVGSTILNGQIGQVSNVAVLQSNHVATNSDAFYIMAGHGDAITVASKISKLEAYSPQLRFADAIKGLNYYGAKVVRPDALALLYVTISA